MSKRLGNSVDPFEIIQQYGPDALRWYMISNANPWDNLKFDPEGPLEVVRKFFFTLYNTYNFFALYANLDGFTAAEESIPLPQRPEIDRWILSRLHSLIQLVTAELDAYEPTKACRAIQDFVVDDLSNWYVRLNRKRFWKSEPSPDKTAAYQTLYTCLHTVAQLAAPIAPFYAEHIYQDLQAVKQGQERCSVHLGDWPVIDQLSIDLALEAKMRQAQTIVSLVHSIRKKHTIKVRQPLTKLLIPVTNRELRAQIEDVAGLILAETNVKQITYIDDTSGVVSKKVKPNFKQLTQRYKAEIKQISDALAALSQADIQILEQRKALILPIGSQDIHLSLDDVILTSEDIPGWSVATDAGVTVALDITVTDELRQEGIARDIVNRIQNMRKAMGLAVQDKIQLTISSQEDFVSDAVATYQAYICQETQAVQLKMVEGLEQGEQVDIDGYVLWITVEVIAGGIWTNV